jgi:hypothetical protein
LDRARRDQSAARGRTSGGGNISSQLPTEGYRRNEFDGRNEHTSGARRRGGVGERQRRAPTLIADWRERFQVGDFPFLIVSLPNYNPLQKNPVEPDWAEIRESQWHTVRTVRNTGLAMTPAHRTVLRSTFANVVWIARRLHGRVGQA